MSMKIYLVETKPSKGSQIMVRAKSLNHAIRHAAQSVVDGRMLDADEAVTFLATGTKVETAGDTDSEKLPL